jgi:hypothetical protein
MLRAPKANIWIWEIIGKTMRPLPSDEGAGSSTPLWTRDGKRILYSSDREDVFTSNACRGLITGLTLLSSDTR